MFVGVLFFATAVVALFKKNEELTFYQVVRVAAVALLPKQSVFQVLMINVYYRERNATAKFCHRRTSRKHIARKGLDLTDFH